MEFGVQNTHRCSRQLISFHLSVLVLGLHQMLLVPAGGTTQGEKEECLF